MALFVLICLPSAFFLWMLIHPFARFWRKFGFMLTYGFLSLPVAGIILGIVLARNTLLAVDLGTNHISMLLGLFCLIVAIIMTLQRRKHLSFSILAGMPELSNAKYPGELLTDGIYAKIRHPRYVEVVFWLLGFVLFANYLMPYLFLIPGAPGLYVIILLEEHELRARFGVEYEEYCRRVPRFVPIRYRKMC